MILPITYQVQVLQMLHNGQGHHGVDQTIAFCREQVYWNTMCKDVAEYVKDCLHCQEAKGPCAGPKTQPGSIIANVPLDLLCVDFTITDPSRDGKENVLVLTDAFSKFSHAFVTPNQKPLTVAKLELPNGSMSMAYHQGYIVTKAIHLRMLFWSTYTYVWG